MPIGRKPSRPLPLGRMKLGVEFQLVDDVLDYGGKAAKLGKNIGDDFREDKIALPVVLAFRRGNDSERLPWHGAGAPRVGDGDLVTPSAWSPSAARSRPPSATPSITARSRSTRWRCFPASPMKTALQQVVRSVWRGRIRGEQREHFAVPVGCTDHRRDPRPRHFLRRSQDAVRRQIDHPNRMIRADRLVQRCRNQRQLVPRATRYVNHRAPESNRSAKHDTTFSGSTFHTACFAGRGRNSR